jgi:hypothetical protein
MSPSRLAAGKRRRASKSRTLLDRPPPQRGWKKLAYQNRAAGEIAAFALCFRADGHTNREPHRRALFHSGVPRLGVSRPAPGRTVKNFFVGMVQEQRLLLHKAQQAWARFDVGHHEN